VKEGGVFGFFPTKGLFLVIYNEQPKEMHKMPFKLEHWVLQVNYVKRSSFDYM
jgi:hypothetical protein